MVVQKKVKRWAIATHHTWAGQKRDKTEAPAAHSWPSRNGTTRSLRGWPDGSSPLVSNHKQKGIPSLAFLASKVKNHAHDGSRTRSLHTAGHTLIPYYTLVYSGIRSLLFLGLQTYPLQVPQHNAICICFPFTAQTPSCFLPPFPTLPSHLISSHLLLYLHRHILSSHLQQHTEKNITTVPVQHPHPHQKGGNRIDRR